MDLRARLPSLLASVLAGVSILCLASCFGDGDDAPAPQNPELPNNQTKLPNSVAVASAPVERARRLVAKLNQYRRQSFGMPLDVYHDNQLYTAALRHAIYLNTINSRNYSPNGATQSRGPIEEIITPSSELQDLADEPEVGGVGLYPFPALYTHPTLLNRVRSVAGGNEFINSFRPGIILFENYVFNGNIIDPEDENGVSSFRGFNLNTHNDADPTRYRFDEADNLWYSRPGRLMAVRANVRAVGYAAATDKGGYQTPYPLFNGQFRGVWITAGSADHQAMLSYWPNDNQTDVTPYGLDTDVEGRVQYAGPPIHLTIPVAEPIMNANSASAAAVRGVALGFRKLTTIPGSSEVQAPIAATITPTIKVFWGAAEAPRTWYSVPLGGGPGYDYTGEDSEFAIEPGFDLRDGELFIWPTEPLEPNTWYEIGLAVRTASYSFTDTSNPSGNPLGLRTWRFRTNNNTPPVGY